MKDRREAEDSWVDTTLASVSTEQRGFAISFERGSTGNNHLLKSSFSHADPKQQIRNILADLNCRYMVRLVATYG